MIGWAQNKLVYRIIDLLTQCRYYWSVLYACCTDSISVRLCRLYKQRVKHTCTWMVIALVKTGNLLTVNQCNSGNILGGKSWLAII